MGNHVKINNISDALNFIEADATAKGRRKYWEDSLSKEEKTALIPDYERVWAEVIAEEKLLSEIEFSDDFLENKEMISGLKGLMPIYQGMEPKAVKELPEDKQKEFKKLSALEANNISAIKEVDRLENKKKKLSKNVRRGTFLALATGTMAEFLINTKDSILYKSVELIGDENAFSMLVGSCVVATSAALLSWGVGKTVSKITYDNKIKDAEASRDSYADEFEENQDAYTFLYDFNRNVEIQHYENKEILETKARGQNVLDALELKI